MAKIVLVEPDRILAEIYSRALEAAGHQVAACPTAQSGLTVADQIQPDIVIVELQLVSHSGIEFLYEFRSYSDWQDTPILIHSQVPQSEFVDSLDLLKKQLNVAAYLYKPRTSLQELLNSIEQNLPVKA